MNATIERTAGAGLAAASGSAFQREYLGVPWTPSPEEKRLRELAHEYHERTERFDQIHCKARDKRGIAIPVMPDERSACTKNAMRVRDELGVEAARLGFTPKQWHEAISNAAHEMPNDPDERPAKTDA